MEPQTPAEWFVALAGTVTLMDMTVRLGILVAVVYTLIQQADIRRRLDALELVKSKVPSCIKHKDAPAMGLLRQDWRETPIHDI